MTRLSILVLAANLWLGTAAAAGLPDEPIYLEADRVDIDEKQGISKYQGHVRLTRGTMSFTAEVMEVHKNRNELEKILAEGNPVTFRREASGEEKEVRGQAKHLEYRADLQLVTLQGDAKLWQDKDEFSGSVIKYDIATERVYAAKGQTDERVKVIIHPKEKTSQ